MRESETHKIEFATGTNTSIQLETTEAKLHQLILSRTEQIFDRTKMNSTVAEFIEKRLSETIFGSMLSFSKSLYFDPEIQITQDNKIFAESINLATIINDLDAARKLQKFHQEFNKLRLLYFMHINNLKPVFYTINCED